MRVKQQSWFVEGTSLRTRTRQGGRVALKGFEYQASHALHFIVQLLFCEDGLVQVRYEGAQDVDTMYGDGKQVFIQYKDTPEKEYNFESVRDILHGFMCDAIDACGSPPDVNNLEKIQLKFVLVASGVLTGQEMLRLIRGSYSRVLAKELVKKFKYLDNQVTKPQDTLIFALYVVRNTSVRLSPQLKGQQHDQEQLVFAKLAMFGIPLTQIRASMDSLKGLLTPPRNLYASDAALALVGLPKFHPANVSSPIRFLPSENSFHDIPSVEREFRESGRVSWAAIHYSLDARRDCSRDIYNALIAMGRKAAVVLVTGNSASGKSTVVRRIGWDLYRAGRALVFEVVESQHVDLEAWTEVARLGEIACKPVIIICDEVDSESVILELVRHQPHAKLIVLASARDESVIPRNFPVHVSPHKLGAVSEEEFKQLLQEMDLTDKKVNAAKFSPLMRAGDIFTLSLMLGGSSLDEIATRTLGRVEQLIPDLYLAFLCLCACGVRDQGVPRRLLLRLQGEIGQWGKAVDEGLVFVEIGDRLRSGHARLASAILRRSGASAVDLKMQLLQQVDVANERERRFGLGLLKNGLNEQAAELASFSAQLTSFMEALASEGDYLDLARGLEVLKFLTKVGMNRLADVQVKLLAAMGPDRVRTGHDAVRFMSHADDYKTAFPVVARVFAQPGISFGRNTFMRWVINKGAGHLAQQREAVAINLRWLRSDSFPPSQTIKLVDCIVNGNTSLPADAQAEFAEILKDILDAMPLPPPDTATWELLYAVCDAIVFRIRDEMLISRLLDRLERYFDAAQLSANLKLLGRLAFVAQVGCGDAEKKRVFRFLVSSLPLVPVKQMYRVYLVLLRSLPMADKPTVLAWKHRFRTIDLAQATATVDEYMEALPTHLRPVP
ncbi:ATP-binding protein [Pseudomonas fluorescens BBc6R8]|uniref:P-loop NTPase n=1 Tax=Pseudomonas fluorescens TaxID=294 RepID=UPI000281CA18|nr:ATP-binding protein [Pseudomonas fluorescens]QQD55372.1 ATP-binding protein [Pseudomonas fluorescens BBc6R8]